MFSWKCLREIGLKHSRGYKSEKTFKSLVWKYDCRTKNSLSTIVGPRTHSEFLIRFNNFNRIIVKFKNFSGAHERLGTTDVQQSIQVKALYPHEGFSMRHLKNDIALLHLSTTAQLSDKVNLVCLPDQGSRISAGHPCYITGMTS